MTEQEKKIIDELNHPLYTSEFVEEWANRNDNVFTNAPAALQAMGAKGFLTAVEIMARQQETSGGQQDETVCGMCEAYMSGEKCDLADSCPAAGIVKRLKEAEATIKEKDKEIRGLKKKLSDSEIARSYMIDPMAIGDRHEMGG